MALIVPDQGELRLLDTLLRLALSTNEDQILKLYKNNYTPDNAAAPASFTEADFSNYVAKTLARGSWNAAATVSGKAESSYAIQSWTCGTTGNTVYGYWVEGSTSNKVLWAEKFSTARTLASGDVLNVVPKFSLYSDA